MVETPAQRPAWKRLVSALLIILAVSGCHFSLVFACNHVAGSIPVFGQSVEDDEWSEVIDWIGLIGFVVLSFPVG